MSSPGSGALPAPTSVTARYLGEGRIAVRWAAVPGATVYDILAHKPGDASWYPLTTKPISAKGFVTNPATGINVPAGAVELVVVPRLDAQDNTGARSTPVQLNVPRYSGRYRVTVNGFRVNRETIDAQMNFDGKNDEVYVRVGVREFDSDGKPVGPERVARTKTHGDQNAERWRQQGSATFRVAAGNASALGGLKTGNGYPNQVAPWGPATGTSNETFPLFVWEGYLLEGGNAVVIVPVIYEDDENAFELVPETRTLLDVGAWMGGRGYQPIETGIEGEEVYGRKSIVVERKIRAQALVAQAGAVNLSSHFQGTGAVVRQAGQSVGSSAGAAQLAMGTHVHVALAGWNKIQQVLRQSGPSLLSNYTAAASLLLNNKDRPIGMAGIQNGEIIFDPEIIGLSFEKAEQFLATKNPNSDIPAGIIEVRYVDTVPGGNGDYTLYLEIKRLQ